MKIDGKRVVITGASSGIGRALASALAKKGASLVLAARRRDRLNQAVGEIGSAFPDAPTPLAIPCDVSDIESVRKLVRDCEERLGGIDIWINNAGIGVYGANEKTPLEDFRWVMEVNFLSAVHCMLRVLPTMRKQKSGLIVNIASISAIHGVPYMGAYCASKAALANLCQSLRAELADTAIRIMIVYPDYTETEFFQKEKHVGGGHRPPGPYGPAQRVAEAIVKGIEREKRDLILSFQGKGMKILESLAPWMLERAMRRIARDLHDE